MPSRSVYRRAVVGIGIGRPRTGRAASSRRSGEGVDGGAERSERRGRTAAPPPVAVAVAVESREIGARAHDSRRDGGPRACVPVALPSLTESGLGAVASCTAAVRRVCNSSFRCWFDRDVSRANDRTWKARRRRRRGGRGTTRSQEAKGRRRSNSAARDTDNR